MMTALLFVLSSFTTAFASDPYTPARAQNAPTVAVERAERQKDGTVVRTIVEQPAAADGYGNAAGNQFDLARDGAFEGQTVAVLHLYTGEGFDFSLPTAAIKEKGFSVYRWVNQPPPVAELRAGLAKSAELWVISGPSQQLTPEHLQVIREFWDAGHGVYVFGDNQPYYADANAVAEVLFAGHMEGNLAGNQTVGVRDALTGPGILRAHDITTGLEHLYEGVTIATIAPNDALQPLVVGSAGNLVTAVFEHQGKRAIFDGGFTRLYVNWDTAGTARYVKNAAAWLANYERFGDAVLASK